MVSYRKNIGTLVDDGVLACGNCHAVISHYNEILIIDLDARSVMYKCRRCGHGGTIIFSRMEKKLAKLGSRHSPGVFVGCMLSPDDMNAPYIIVKDGRRINEHLVKCERCGEKFRDNETKQREGLVYCIPCFTTLFFACECCHGYFNRDEQNYTAGGAVCSTCYNELFEVCPSCNGIAYVGGFHDVRSLSGIVIGRVCEDCWNATHHSRFNKPPVRFRHVPELDEIIGDPGSEA